MSRPKKDPVEAAFTAWAALNFDQRMRLDAMIMGYNAGLAGEPKRTPPKTTAAKSARAAKPATELPSA